ncbi:MAG: peptide deformylase [Candidatus Dadabacteria bacterium]|nr:MAG: peptide deformylase [Candidatus Dadabacteria bacterium]
MALRKIVFYPDPLLREKCPEVESVDDALKGLIQDMYETMYEGKGIGLAAPQVGVLKRLIVVDVSEERNNPLCFVNPVITRREGKIKFEEGCLSIPGYRDYVQRPDKITVKALNEDGKEFTMDAEGLLSVCIQHEIDHLDGILFIDRLSPLKQEFFKKWYSKRSGDYP